MYARIPLHRGRLPIDRHLPAVVAASLVASTMLLGGALAEEEREVRPGVMIQTTGHGQCTANFAFENQTGSVFLGTASHCVEHDVGADVHLVQEGVAGEVSLARGPLLGHVAYSSWEVLDVQAEPCLVLLSCIGHDNDFALVDVREELEDTVKAGLYVYGGPTDVQPTEQIAPLDRVASFGNSSLRPGPDIADRHHGVVQQESSEYTVLVNFDNPCILGGSGSPVLTEDGRALGVLVSLGAGYNGVTMLEPALAFAEDEGGMGDLELLTAPLETPLFTDLPVDPR